MKLLCTLLETPGPYNFSMAALPDQTVPAVVDLRQIQPDDIDPLLEEEIGVWQESLNWDFRPSADLVRRFVRMQALGGYGLVSSDRVIGYCYYVCEDNKGLVGDLYVSPRVLGPLARGDFESRLLRTTIGALMATPGVHRVESQLLMMSPEGRKRMPFPARLECFPRKFMTGPLAGAPGWPSGEAPRFVDILPWHERDQEQAARLIAKAYRGHIDSRINDQYDSVSGARHFLQNIVQYPGCGSFFQPGSFAAVERRSGKLAGLALASLVAYNVGHITQLCVDPPFLGRGVGYELLRRCLCAMASGGCQTASLTVTSANESAVRLYERLGFSVLREFEAFVWSGIGG